MTTAPGATDPRDAILWYNGEANVTGHRTMQVDAHRHDKDAGRAITRLSGVLAAVLLASCTTFASVRPAQVLPGRSVVIQAAASAPPGELPGWIWSFDCADGCNRSVPGLEIGYAHGVSDSTHAWYVEGGIALPVTPYIEAYRQVGDRSRPRGIGARVGVPTAGWGEYRVFYRTDPRPHLTANSHLVVASGRSPNRENSATFMALIQSVGLMRKGTTSGFIPAFSFGITRTTRNRYGEQETAAGLLAVLSLTGRLR